MTGQISEGRKAAYYVGIVLAVTGGLLFLSVFVTAALHFGDFTHFESDARSSMFRALAGSGVVLDPKKAREDLEPYSRMAGGMVKDALDEADISLGGKREKVIMIKCRA